MSTDPFALERYAQALDASAAKLPRQSAASEHARVRGAWRNAIPKVIAATPERALATPIAVRAPSIAVVKPEKGHDRAWLIANEMAKKMKQVLFARAKRAGARHTGSTRVVRPWTRAARESAKGWMATQGGTLAWESAFDALASACNQTATCTVAVERLGWLARAESAAHERVRRAPPWLAAKVVREGPEALLAASVGAWRAWAVNTERAALGAAPLDEAQAEEALATWAWPRCEPPLAMVALCYETGAFASESAWANALENAKGKRWRALARMGAKKGLDAAAAAGREDEEGPVREAERRVRALAHEAAPDHAHGRGAGRVGAGKIARRGRDDQGSEARPGRLRAHRVAHPHPRARGVARLGGDERAGTGGRGDAHRRDHHPHRREHELVAAPHGGMDAKRADAVRDAVRRVLGREVAGQALEGVRRKTAWQRAA